MIVVSVLVIASRFVVAQKEAAVDGAPLGLGTTNYGFIQCSHWASATAVVDGSRAKWGPRPDLHGIALQGGGAAKTF